MLCNDNADADELAKMGSRRAPVSTGVFIQQLHQPTIREEHAEPADSITSKPDAVILSITPEWTAPYLNYLLNDELPEDRTEAERITRRSRLYTVVGHELYRKSPSGVLMRCISEDNGRKATLRDSLGYLRQPPGFTDFGGQGVSAGLLLADRSHGRRRHRQFFAQQIHVPAQ